MGKESKREQTKQMILAEVTDFLRTRFDCQVDKVDKSKIMMPWVDEDGEEFYFTFQATIPRGKRVDGTYKAYDGCALAQTYALQEKYDAEQKAIKEQQKALEAAKKVEGKRVRKAIQNLEKAMQKAGE